LAWRIKFSGRAVRQLRKLDPVQARRIRDFLRQRLALLDDPRRIGKPLKGELAELWRYRVGDYRLICEIQDDRLVVLVIRIAHREQVYR